MRLLIMGPPGAGKGTQAKLIAARYAIPAISTGDIFRAMQTADTPLAKQVREIMASGGYISDEVTNQIVADRLAQADCESGFLLDGYPRTIPQAEALDQMLVEKGMALDAVVEITADADTLTRRIVNRAKENAGAGARADDNEDVIRNRLAVYREQTAPLVEHYRQKGLLRTVDGMAPVEQVAAAISKAVGA